MSFGSLINFPLTFKEATPLKSVALHFMNLQKRFMLLKLLGSDSRGVTMSFTWFQYALRKSLVLPALDLEICALPLISQ